MGRKSKLTKEEKLQLCKDKLELGLSFKPLSQKYLIKQTVIQRLIRKYLIHGESIFNEKYVRFPRKDLEKLTGVDMPPNKRNGRKRNLHLKIARNIQEILDLENNKTWRNIKGQPTKENIVIEYKKNNPNASMYRCQKETGLSKNTIKKYWNIE